MTFEPRVSLPRVGTLPRALRGLGRWAVPRWTLLGLLAHRQQETRRPFLFDVTALSHVFRGKFSAGLQRARRRAPLRYCGHSAALAEPGPWEELLTALWKQDWVVYAKPPFGGPAHVLKYLSRYTHRVALSNQRLVFVGDGVVRFRYKDYAGGGTTKTREVQAEEFLRRFLLHVVPSGFVRIRHFGLLATRTRQEKLARCHQLLAVAAAAATSLLPPTTPEPSIASAETTPAARCPACGSGSLRVLALVAPDRGHPP